jgi:hypothetical protein
MSHSQIARRVLHVSKKTLIALLMLPSLHIILLCLCPASAKLINGLFIAGAQIAGQVVLLYSLQVNMLAATGKGILASIISGFKPPDPLVSELKSGTIMIGSAIKLSHGVAEHKTERRLKQLEKNLEEYSWKFHEIEQKQTRFESSLDELRTTIEEVRSGTHFEAIQNRSRARERAIASIDRELLVMFFISYSSVAGVLVSVFN